MPQTYFRSDRDGDTELTWPEAGAERHLPVDPGQLQLLPHPVGGAT